MTKASAGRNQRRKLHRQSLKAANVIGGAEARRKLAEWAIAGGHDLDALMKMTGTEFMNYMDGVEKVRTVPTPKRHRTFVTGSNQILTLADMKEKYR